MQTTQQPTLYKCYKCGKEFDNRNALAGHISHHNRTELDYKKKGQKTGITRKKLFKEGILKNIITKEQREKMSRCKRDKKNPNYKKGIIKMFSDIIQQTEACVICGSKKILCIHHIDCNHDNNNKDNLTVVCKKCHDKIHQRGYNFRKDLWSVRINEVFSSIQCEGKNNGLASHFIRLQGCSLKCEWCDSKDSWCQGKSYNHNEIVELFKTLIKEYPKITNIVLTGGEPLEQNYYPIVLLCKIFGFTVEVETNSTPSFPYNRSIREVLHKEVDLYTFSPKLWINDILKKLQNKKINILKEFNYVFKFVIDKEKDFIIMEKLIKQGNIPEEKVFIQPQYNNKEMIKKCVDYIKEHHRSKLSMQIHKLIGVQ